MKRSACRIWVFRGQRRYLHTFAGLGSGASWRRLRNAVLTKTDSAVALATSSLNVLSAEIGDFVVPDTVTPSEYKDVQITVANYQGSQIGATAEVLIINEHGVEVGRLLEQNFVIPFNSQQTATWSWNPESLEVGPYTLHPQATAGGLALSYAAQETCNILRTRLQCVPGGRTGAPQGYVHQPVPGGFHQRNLGLW